jgi:hypothetical protein
MDTRTKYNPTLYSNKIGAITGFPGPQNSVLAAKSCPGPNLYKKGGMKKRTYTRSKHSRRKHSRRKHSRRKHSRSKHSRHSRRRRKRRG